jgi:PAS domain S-box-containing protein
MGPRKRGRTVKRNKNFISTLLNSIPIPVFYKDKAGRYQGCNNAFTQIMGITSEEIQGKTVHELWPSEQAEVYHRKDLELMEHPQRQTYDFEVTDKNGDVRSVIFTKDVFYDEDSNVAGLIGTFLDVTERKRAEEALLESQARLHESEERFREAFAHAPVGMVIADIEGCFLEVNESFSRMLGYDVEELLGTGCSFKDFTHADDLEHNLVEWRRLLAGEIPAFGLEKRYVRKDGGIIWARTSVTLRRDLSGRPFQAVAIIENIQDRKQAEEEIKKAKTAAEEATRAKSEFLANMSHEIRTPMTVFMAATEHLLQADLDTEHRQLLEMADQAAERLRSLIDDILDLSRIEAGKVELEEKPFNLHTCVREVVEMFSLGARQKNLRLETEISPEVTETVFGDSDRLGQVLINLIGNAVKFTAQGEVRVCVRLRNSLLEFAVSDTGIGIPESKCDLLFKSFSQVDSSFTRKFGGTGLGLAISKELVELMGGEIGVSSREGEGSVFLFTLPFKPVEKRHSTPAEEQADRREAPLPNVHILLAEDDPAIRKMVLVSLARNGWKTETAENGREAVQKWAEGDFDLILMDLQMPEMDGLQATMKIRETEACGENGTGICIVGLTAHARREVKVECLKAGMDQVLIKPVPIKELLSVVERCISDKLDQTGINAKIDSDDLSLT